MDAPEPRGQIYCSGEAEIENLPLESFHKVPNKTGESNQGKQGGGYAGWRVRTLGDVGTCPSLGGGLVMGRLPNGLPHRVSKIFTVSGEKGREVE